ncbi:hypothetical protein A5821_001694 [Enterococcus sp. 7F3_DIV0205]|uniref:Radical SAM core domain-containing protein n=1 Tax=Candidatus Enterococcus palustris TaxID=1834189 RepID=A0AAQ3Y7P5_9ENTE|nr:PqqD family peptide modification chaperone [Enterococcus sp. 7F3_DIV0205]OTN86089.1 hypothetical protein A5821_002039 [Enterococcus sp. 7F3_DIV0205]
MYYFLKNSARIQISLDKYYLSFIESNTKCIVELNKSGFEILSLCNGKNTLDMIINQLYKRYPAEDTAIFIKEFLQTFENSKVVEKKAERYSGQNQVIYGTNEYYCPVSIMLELTNYCPLDCLHCYLGKKKNQHMGKNDLIKILESITSLGVQYIQLTGGEVLTYPHLEYAIDYLVSNHVQVNISTSGIIVNDNIIETVSKIKNTGGIIRVSLDGLPEYHNKIRQNKKSFQNATEFLKRIMTKKIPCEVATCIIDQNKEDIFELVKFTKELGVHKHAFELVYLQGNAQNNNIESNYRYRDFEILLEELSEEYDDKKFSISKAEECHEATNCGAGYKTYKISYDMKVTPCITMNYELGDLTESTFSEIISKHYESFQNLQAPCKMVCGDCELVKHCEMCMSKALQYKDSVKNCSWFKSQNVLVDKEQTYVKN